MLARSSAAGFSSTSRHADPTSVKRETITVKCRQARVLISEDLNDSLTPDQQQALEAHLSRCRRCRVLSAYVRQAVTLLRQLPEDAPTPGFWQRLRPRVPESPKRRWAWVPVLSVRQRRELALPAAAAAVAMLALVCWRPTVRQPSRTAPPSQSLYVLQCVEQHASYGGDNPLLEEALLIDTTTGEDTH